MAGEIGFPIGALVASARRAPPRSALVPRDPRSQRRTQRDRLDAGRMRPAQVPTSASSPTCDATWYVFMPTLSGDILIEAVRRGVPLHRFAQIPCCPRTEAAESAPRLRQPGRHQTTRHALQERQASALTKRARRSG